MIKNSEVNAKIAESFRETNDCNVRAMANALGINYRQAHAYHKKRGRKNRRGTSGQIVRDVIKDYAQEVFMVQKKYLALIPQVMEIIESADLPRTVNQFTKDSRFQKGRFIVYVRGHAIAIVDGKTQDWVSENRQHRIVFFIKVKKER